MRRLFLPSSGRAAGGAGPDRCELGGQRSGAGQRHRHPGRPGCLGRRRHRRPARGPGALRWATCSGPFELAPGEHDVSFSGADVAVDSTLTSGRATSSDVVLHLPAEVGRRAGGPLLRRARPARSVRARHASCWPTPPRSHRPTSRSTARRSSPTSPTASSPTPTSPRARIEVALLPSGTRRRPDPRPAGRDPGGAHALDDLRLRQPAGRVDERHRPHRAALAPTAACSPRASTPARPDSSTGRSTTFAVRAPTSTARFSWGCWSLWPRRGRPDSSAHAAGQWRTPRR